VPKYRMGKLELPEGELSCAVGVQWPPIEMVAYGPPAGDMPLDQAVQMVREQVDSATYAKIRVWQGACGLYLMKESKCGACPYRVLNGARVVPAGGEGPAPPTTRATPVTSKRRRKK